MEENATISQDTAPVETASFSLDEGASAIEKAFGLDPEQKPDPAQPKREAQTQEQPTEASAEDDDDDEELVLDATEDDEDADASAGPSEASDDALVTLPDGQKITVAQLKRNNLFQSDYSRKTEELKAEKTRLEQEHQSRLAEAEQALQKRSQLIMAYAERHIPQEPNPAMMDENSQHYDPIGYMQARTRYDQEMGQLHAIVQQQEREQQEHAQKTQAERQQIFQSEVAKLGERLPYLKKEGKAKKFEEAIKTMVPKYYGLDAQAVFDTMDHRSWLIVHDALKYRELKAGAEPVKQELASAPKIQGKQRMNVQSTQQRDREGKFQAAKQSGSIKSAASALEALLGLG